MSRQGELVRVLLVEDDEDDYVTTRDMLAQVGSRFELDWCADCDTALVAIREQRHDIYLLDYRLAGHTGLDLVRAGFIGPAAPIIILTRQSDDEIDLQASALGVADFLVKQELTAASLERSIRYVISHHTARADLARSEERYRLLAENSTDLVARFALDGKITYASPASRTSRSSAASRR